MKEAVLGIDAGTRSVKAALFDEQGEVLAEASASYTLHVPRHGWAEQTPSHWWHALCSTPRALRGARGADGVRIAATGVCAQMCGTVLVDKSGTPPANCLTWPESR